jgi:ribosomal protein L40E
VRRCADEVSVEDLLETASRCPHCRASVRPGAPWCTLCHADLRPPPEPVAAAPAAAAPVVRAALLDPLTAPAAALGLPSPPGSEPTWPCSTCGATNPIAADTCASCGAGFLAGLRESEAPLLELPGVGDLTRMSRGQRLGIAFGVVLAFVALTALLSLLFG